MENAAKMCVRAAAEIVHASFGEVKQRVSKTPGVAVPTYFGTSGTLVL